MKYLRKFDSVSEMNTAIASSEISIMGLAYDGTSATIKNHEFVPQPNDEIWYTSSDGNIVTPYRSAFGSGITVVSNTYSGGKGIIKLSGNATIFGGNAFYGCTGLTSVTIPNGVVEIFENTFSECTGLTSITIPDSVTSIGSYAFEGCTGLTSVTIGNGVNNIGDWVFEGCTGITSITIPNSVTSIGYKAFNNVPHIYYNGSATGSPWGALAIN